MPPKSRQEVRYGLYIPNFGLSSYPKTLVEMACDAEESGWDGFFLWDHLVDEKNRPVPIAEPFTILAAIATKTTRIRIGTTVTPLPRRRPWLVARQTASLDHLSNGRLTLGVGLGFRSGDDYTTFGETADIRVRAEKLDEALEVITGLWSGKLFGYEGKHYKIKKTRFLPPPRQKPRIPIWVGGFWPNKGPFQRAAKWDGVIPLKLPTKMPEPKDLREILTYVASQRKSMSPFDVAAIGWTKGKDPSENRRKITPYIDAGMTWWLEGLYMERNSPKDMRKRILQGPPVV